MTSTEAEELALLYRLFSAAGRQVSGQEGGPFILDEDGLVVTHQRDDISILEPYELYALVLSLCQHHSIAFSVNADVVTATAGTFSATGASYILAAMKLLLQLYQQHKP